MKFVQIGREVFPRLLKERVNNRAVITDIKNDLFVIIMKQDKSKEIVRVKDIVLTDKVYTKEELENDDCSFYKMESVPKPTTDFDRFVANLRKKVIDELVKEKVSSKAQ